MLIERRRGLAQSHHYSMIRNTFYSNFLPPENPIKKWHEPTTKKEIEIHVALWHFSPPLLHLIPIYDLLLLAQNEGKSELENLKEICDFLRYRANQQNYLESLTRTSLFISLLQSRLTDANLLNFASNLELFSEEKIEIQNLKTKIKLFGPPNIK